LLEMSRFSAFTVTILVLSFLFSSACCAGNQTACEDNALSLFFNTMPSDGADFHELVVTLIPTKVPTPNYRDYKLAIALSCSTIIRTLEGVKLNADSSTKQKTLQDIAELASTINYPLDASKACEYLNQVSSRITNDNYEDVTEVKRTLEGFVNSQPDIVPYLSELTPFYDFLRSLSNKDEKDASLMKRIYDLLYQVKNDNTSHQVVISTMKGLLNEMSKMERAKPCLQSIEVFAEGIDDPFNMGHFCDYLGRLLGFMVCKFEMNRSRSASTKN